MYHAGYRGSPRHLGTLTRTRCRSSPSCIDTVRESRMFRGRRTPSCLRLGTRFHTPSPCNRCHKHTSCSWCIARGCCRGWQQSQGIPGVAWTKKVNGSGRREREKKFGSADNVRGHTYTQHRYNKQRTPTHLVTQSTTPSVHAHTVAHCIARAGRRMPRARVRCATWTRCTEHHPTRKQTSSNTTTQTTRQCARTSHKQHHIGKGKIGAAYRFRMQIRRSRSHKDTSPRPCTSHGSSTSWHTQCPTPTDTEQTVRLIAHADKRSKWQRQR